MSYQKLTIAGNLGRDPEMRYTPGGHAVTNFSVATNRTYTDSSGTQQKETMWIRVSAWGKLAEICNQFLRSGSKVLVEGRLTPDKETGGPRVYESNGQHRASYEMTADNVIFMDSRSDNQQNQNNDFGDDDFGDVPF